MTWPLCFNTWRRGGFLTLADIWSTSNLLSGHVPQHCNNTVWQWRTHTPRDITSGAKFRSVSRPVSQIVLSHLMMTNTHSLNVMALLCLIYTEHDSLNSTRLSQRTCPAAISPDWVLSDACSSAVSLINCFGRKTDLCNRCKINDYGVKLKVFFFPPVTINWMIDVVILNVPGLS